MLADVSQLLPLLAGYTVADLPHDSSVDELERWGKFALVNCVRIVRIDATLGKTRFDT